MKMRREVSAGGLSAGGRRGGEAGRQVEGAGWGRDRGGGLDWEEQQEGGDGQDREKRVGSAFCVVASGRSLRGLRASGPAGRELRASARGRLRPARLKEPEF